MKASKNLIPLLFLLIPSLSFTPPAKEIRWSTDRRLSYTDFGGPVPSSSPWAATTNSSIYFSYQETNGQLKSVTVYSSFDPASSWMKTQTPEVLRHEQLHFDITEYFARKFYADASAFTYQPDGGRKLKDLFQQVNQDCAVTQNSYDEESEHGVNSGNQKNWEEKVHRWLKETPAYPAAQ